MGKIRISIIGIVICIMVLSSITSFLIVERGEAQYNRIYVNISYPYVDGDGSANRPYRSIQYAIDVADEGDTIFVFEGLYNETLKIDKELSVIGLDRDNTTIDKKNYVSKYLIEITADNVTLEDFTISDTSGKNRAALIYVTSNRVIIEGNNITHSKTRAIYFDTSHDNTVGNNLINDTKGIYLFSSNSNVFSQNKMDNCTDAAILLASSSSGCIVYNNSFNNSKYAIFADSSSNNNISENTIAYCNIDGVKLNGGTGNKVADNRIRNCNGKGVDFKSSNGEIFRNKFDNNQIGILVGRFNSQINDNFLNDSKISGIETDPGSNNNIIYSNRFLRNNVNAKEYGSNQWHNGTHGNYWDDYNEVDKDLDKIGDVPYLISSGGEDLYPLGYFLKPPDKPTDPSPSDGAENTTLSVTLSVTVTDSDSEELEVYFYSATDGELYGIDYNVQSGGTASCSFSLPFETTFLWYATATDDKLENQSDIWIFTTRLIPPTNKKPVADPGGPYTVGIGEEITFDASGSNDPDGTIDFYRWSFGDGSSQILDISPTHIYTETGSFTITLTVVDNEGRTSTATTNVNVLTPSNKPPVAVIGGPYSTDVDELFTFNAANSYDPGGIIADYIWDFGDGSTGYGLLVNHTYSTAGTYLVTLTVIDNESVKDSATTFITVESSSEGTPGFELLVIFLALSLVLFFKRKIRS